MPLGSIDVDINPDTTGLVAKLEADLARVTSPTVSADVVPQVDVGAAARVDEVLQADLGRIDTTVVAHADLTSAKIAGEQIDAVVSRSVEDRAAALIAKNFGAETAQIDTLRTGFQGVANDLETISTKGGTASLALGSVTDELLATGPAGLAAAAGLAAVATPFLALAGFVGAPILLGSEQPAIAKKLDEISEAASRFTDNLVDTALPGTEQLLDVVAQLFDEFAPLGAVIGEISGELSAQLADVLQQLIDDGTIEDVVQGLSVIVELLGKLAQVAIPYLQVKFAPFIESMREIAGLAREWNELFGDTPAYVDATATSVADLAGGAAQAAVDSLPKIKGLGDAIAGIGDSVVGNARNVGKDAIDAITAGVEEGIATLKKQYQDRLLDAFTSGPTIAELIAGGKSPEDAVKDYGKLADTLNKQAFGLAALRTKGLNSLLAEAVAIKDPAEAGAFLDSVLRLPPDKLAALEASAKESQRQIGEASKAVAEEQGKDIQAALFGGQQLGILEFGPQYTASVETFFELVGQAASEGFAKGIAGATNPVATAVTGIAGFAERQIRKALKSESPSRVFMDIGNDTGEGFAIGLEQSRGFKMLDQFGVTAPTTTVASQAQQIAAGAAQPAQTWAPTINVNAEQIDPWRTATEVIRVVGDGLHMDNAGPRGIR